MQGLANSVNLTAPVLPESEVRDPVIVILVLVEIVNVFAIAGNILILLVIPRIPEEVMGDATKVCYMGQAATDLGAATLYLLGPVAEAIGQWAGWTRGRLTFCRTVGFLASASPGVSILFIVFLNVDRYLLIVKPMIHRRIAIKWKVVTICATVSTLNVLMLFLFVLFCKHSFQIITFHAELNMCIIDFGEPTFLPFLLPMISIAWLTMLHLVIQYCHIVSISLYHWRKIDNTRRVVQVSGHERSHSHSGQESLLCDVQFQTHDARSSESGISTITDGITHSHSLVLVKSRHHGQEAPSVDGNLSRTRFFQTERHTREHHSPINPSPGDFRRTASSSNYDHHNDEIFRIKNNNSVYTRVVQDKPSTNAGSPVNATSTSDRTGAAAPSKVVNEHQVIAGTAGADRHRIAEQEVRDPQSLLKRNLRIIRTPLIITGLFFVTFLPITFINLYQAVNDVRINPVVHAAFSAVIGLNGSLNILVYYRTIKVFKKTLKRVLRRPQCATR